MRRRRSCISDGEEEEEDDDDDNGVDNGDDDGEEEEEEEEESDDDGGGGGGGGGGGEESADSSSNSGSVGIVGGNANGVSWEANALGGKRFTINMQYFPTVEESLMIPELAVNDTFANKQQAQRFAQLIAVWNNKVIRLGKVNTPWGPVNKTGRELFAFFSQLGDQAITDNGMTDDGIKHLTMVLKYGKNGDDVTVVGYVHPDSQDYPEGATRYRYFCFSDREVLTNEHVLKAINEEGATYKTVCRVLKKHQPRCPKVGSKFWKDVCARINDAAAA
jgi:hypothetical protein